LEVDGVDLVKQVCFCNDEALNIARVDFNGRSDLSNDLLYTFILCFDCDDYPIVKHIEHFIRVDLHFLKEEECVRLQLVQSVVEISLFSLQPLILFFIELNHALCFCEE
jgi:hypothetical protein